MGASNSRTDQAILTQRKHLSITPFHSIPSKKRSNDEIKQQKQKAIWIQERLEREHREVQEKKVILYVPNDELLGEAAAFPSQNEVGQNVNKNKQISAIILFHSIHAPKKRSNDEIKQQKVQEKKFILCVPNDELLEEAGAFPSQNEVGQNVNINEENDYGYEKNSYPLEQLDADIENMMNSDEFKDAIESLKYEMEKEYYENK